MDSLSFYDDVNAPSLGGDLYESIAGSILNLAKRNSSMEDMYSSVLYSPQKPVSMRCFIAQTFLITDGLFGLFFFQFHFQPKQIIRDQNIRSHNSLLFLHSNF
jgi:hypothetical protein